MALVGSDGLVSNSVQAFSQSKCQPDRLRFAIIPIGNLWYTSIINVCVNGGGGGGGGTLVTSAYYAALGLIGLGWVHVGSNSRIY